jgi:hypothetical protein
MSKVVKNKVVTIHYIMRNSRNEVLEDTRNGSPATYLHGGSGILEALQVQLEGLGEGAQKQVHLLKGAGAPEDFVFEVWVEKIREAMPQEIVLGYPLTGTARECAPGCICYY